MLVPRVSLIFPYHDNPDMLLEQYRNLMALPRYLRNQIELVLCDDCSTETPAAPPAGLQASVFRINGAHIPWSHRVATNIAAHESRGVYLLLTDVDHIVPVETWENLLVDPLYQWSRDKVYTFGRINVDGSAKLSHPDTWFMSREKWETIGGYDTRYRGHYGQNMAFIDRVNHHGGATRLPLNVVRYGREDIHDASERVLTRKTPEARAAMSALKRQFRVDGTYFERQPLTQSYHRVF